MHESSLCRGLLERVLEIARRKHAAAITSIDVEVGPLSGIDPAQVADAFPHVSAGTPAQSARLAVTLGPLTVRCLACSAESEATPECLDCRRCGSEETQLLHGTDMMITNVGLSDG